MLKLEWIILSDNDADNAEVFKGTANRKINKRRLLLAFATAKKQEEV